MARKVTNRKCGGRKRLTKDRKSFQKYVHGNLVAGMTNDGSGRWRSDSGGGEDAFKGVVHGKKGGKVKCTHPELRHATFISCGEPNCGTIPKKGEYCLRHQ